MEQGYLKVELRTGEGALPIKNADVTIRDSAGNTLFSQKTDDNGNTGQITLAAPDATYSLDPYYRKAAYSTYDVDVSAEGYVNEHIHGVQILAGETCILPVRMYPLAESESEADDDIEIPPIGLLVPAIDAKVAPPARLLLADVIIPEYITVHLGVPSNASARNVRVKFVDYVKNVTSSEIYATWPDNSIVANVHAIATFAINRVYTEWYRSRGFDFDITNSTQYDQYYRDGAQIYENISRIVDEIFNVYAHRYGFQNPYFTEFCNGTTATCNGMSQWGTVALARQGMTPLEILRYYYVDDMVLTASQNIQGIAESYPGYPLRLGSQGEPVQRIQNQLNRIRVNFSLIPLISNPNGTFDISTENAVRTFQRSFDMVADGIVGRATWNKISFLFVATTRLAALDSEGQRISIGQNPPNVVLSQGATGTDVMELQFILNFISPYHPTIPFVIQDGVFGPGTKNAVIEFQKTFGLTPDGVVGPGTWNKLYDVYRGIDENVTVPPVEPPPTDNIPSYPGTLSVGSTGAHVRLMQSYLNVIGAIYPSIPHLQVDGIFGPNTREAVIAFQRQFGLEQSGTIDRNTWDYIVRQYQLALGNESISLEFPGTLLRLGSVGSNVRLIQGFLSELRSPYPSLPQIVVDGIFGPNTEAAVMAFQRLFGLTPDGIVGPLTWYAIIEERNARV